MVIIKHRSGRRSFSDPHNSTHQNDKFSLPYYHDQVDRELSNGLIDSQRQRPPMPVFGRITKTPYQKASHTSSIFSAVPSLVKILFFIGLCYFIYLTRAELAIRDNDIATISRDLEILDQALFKDDAKLDSARTKLEHLQTKYMALIPGEEERLARTGSKFNADRLYTQIYNRVLSMHLRSYKLQVELSDNI
mmetsp:Transcript_25450/g.29973  ORF Transcript_25450/g.29973 Transcript_25450/m.29973 type:complete len:192 (+) Transcript_25450:62-637(+)